MNMRPIQDILSAFNSANLEDRIRYNLDSVVEKEVKAAYNASHLENAARCMDYTSLRLTDTADTIRNFITDLLKKLKKFELPAVAAVCVFPKYAGIAREMLQSTGIRTAVVAGNFPTAQTFTEIKLAECRKAIEAGAEEIDTVLSVGDLLEKNYEAVYEELCAIREACRQLGTFDLSGCEIYTSCEPCPMCLGAIYWAHIDKIYYGNDKTDAATIGFDDSFIYDELALPREKRQKAMENLLPEEAIAAFELWAETTDKTEY